MTTRKYYPEVDAKGRNIPEVAVADAPRLRQIARLLETSRAIRDAVAAGDLDPVALDLLSEVGLLPGAASRNAGFESSPLGYLQGGTSRITEDLGIRSGNLGPSETAGNRNYGPSPWTQFGTERASGVPFSTALPTRLETLSYTAMPRRNTPDFQKLRDPGPTLEPQGRPGSFFSTQPNFNGLAARYKDSTQYGMHLTNSGGPPQTKIDGVGTYQPTTIVYPKLDDIPAGPGQPLTGPKFDLGPDGAVPGGDSFARWLSGRFNSPATSWNPVPPTEPDRSRPIDGENAGAITAPQFRLHRGALVGVERQPSDAEMIRRPRSNEPDDLRGTTPR